jgi:deoxyribodipyrimidine photo-lyase
LFLFFILIARMASFAKGAVAKTARGGARTVVWFRNDQRVLDNPILHEACKLKNTHVVCVYCFDPRHFAITKYGSKKTAAFRAKFLVESIQTLRSSLRALGSELLVSLGKPEDIIPSLVCADAGNVVLVQQEDVWEEAKVAAKVKAAVSAKGVAMKTFHGATYFHPEDLPYDKDLGNLPDVFSPFKVKVEKLCKPRALMPTPRKGQLKPAPEADLGTDVLACGACGYDYLPTELELGFTEGAFAEAGKGFSKGGVMDFTGGEVAGKARVEDWMFKGDHLKDYFDIRNGMLGESYSSKVSPWLALGNLSPRWIQQECARYESERGIANKSTYWLIFELEVRDFFHFLVQKYGRTTFFKGGMRGLDRPWSTDAEKVRRWKEGTTGMPLVDANMRELATTGWMSNRGRQNVASYLVVDMGVDWRIGADYFESVLLDHDVYSNYGNWNAAAGLTSGRVNRFNTVKQSKDYDVKGDYIRHWIPELANVPAPLCHDPSKMSPADRQRYKAEAYPLPMLLGEPWQVPPSAGGGRGDGGIKKASRGGGGGRGGSGGARRRDGGKAKASVADNINWYVKDGA